MPRGHRGELKEGAISAGIPVAELGDVLVPVHVQKPELDALVEPGAPEDELPQPVDERLALEQADALPVADEVAAERR